MFDGVKLPNIYLIHGDFTIQEMSTLYNHPKIGAFITCTHGEGFGRPMLEASCCDLPVIASKWSGHMDFLTDSESMLIDGFLKEVPKSALWKSIIVEPSKWFNVNEADVVRKVRTFHKKRKLIQKKANRLGKKNRREFSLEAMAKEFSDDLGSGENGGELDWFTKGRMVPPFEKACFEGKVGDMPIVVSQFGVHLIHITDQTEPRKSYLLASVDMPIEPSKYTADMVYKKASKFSVENNTIEKFEASEMEIIPIEGLRAEEEVLGADLVIMFDKKPKKPKNNYLYVFNKSDIKKTEDDYDIYIIDH